MAEDEVARTLLVVDDEDSILQLLNRYLQRQGYAVIATDSATVALGLVQSGAAQIDCVILDIHLGNVYGLDVLRALRAAQPGLGVILISGAPADAADEPLQLDTYTRWLDKPFLLSELLQLIRELLHASPDASREV